MTEKVHQTGCGEIHYWVSQWVPDRVTLVFLPGLTADHRLFDKQIEYFQGRYNLLVWDAPGHGRSWPFRFEFSLMDKAGWLDEILVAEGVTRPVLVGQSMGGYLSQAYAQRFPEKIKGLVSIDSAPLQRWYLSDAELWMLKKMEGFYSKWPWKLIVKAAVAGVSTTEYGRDLARAMTLDYAGDKARYAKVSGYGFRILAQALEADLPYEIPCPALLMCGEQDRSGSYIRYNRDWHAKTGLPLVWVRGAGHNSNADNPEQVNGAIEEFVENRILKEIES